MSSVTIKFDTDSAAFSDNWREAFGRMLHKSYAALADHGEAGRLRGVRSYDLRDVDGNIVGSIEIRED